MATAITAAIQGARAMGGLVYSGKFEEHINELYSPQNISKTAKKFKEYEKKNGPYAFGKFTKFLVPKKENWASESGSTDGHDRWEKHSGIGLGDLRLVAITTVILSR